MIGRKSFSLIERRSLILDVANRWREIYGRGSYAHDVSKQGVQAKLDALDLATCGKEDVAAAIGNTSWTALDCDLCGNDCDVIMRIGETPDYDARWQDICLPCVVSLGDDAAKAMEARRAETLGSVHDSAVAKPFAQKEPS